MADLKSRVKLRLRLPAPGLLENPTRRCHAKSLCLRERNPVEAVRNERDANHHSCSTNAPDAASSPAFPLQVHVPVHYHPADLYTLDVLAVDPLQMSPIRCSGWNQVARIVEAVTETAWLSPYIFLGCLYNSHIIAENQKTFIFYIY